QDARVRSDDLQQIVLVGDAREPILFLRRREIRPVILLAVLDAQDVFANFRAQGRLREICSRRFTVLALAYDEAVYAERFAIEKESVMQPERFVERLVRATLVQRLGIDAELTHQAG